MLREAEKGVGSAQEADQLAQLQLPSPKVIKPWRWLCSALLERCKKGVLGNAPVQ